LSWAAVKSCMERNQRHIFAVVLLCVCWLVSHTSVISDFTCVTVGGLGGGE